MVDIDVYGYIDGEKWADSDVTARDFIKQLRAAGGDDVTIHINSGGGSTTEAAAMADAIRAYKGATTASIEGIAASAASYFALASDRVVMNPYALFMVHNPSGACMGTAKDMRDTADTLDKVRGTIVSAYAKKTGKGADEIGSLMDEETWFTADEALEAGFVDALTDGEPVEARVDEKTVASYRHAPDQLKCRDEKVLGEQESNIQGERKAEKPDAGAAEDETGAVSKVVCVNGTFLNYAKENPDEVLDPDPQRHSGHR